MKYAVALAMLVLPAVLAAKASCPMTWKTQQEAGPAYSLATGWQTSPLFANQIL